MNVSLVERKIVFVAGSHAARFAVLWQGERVVIAEEEIVIAPLRPQRRLAKHFWKNPEHGLIELRIGRGAVSVVPQHQPHIRLTRTRVIGVRVTHRGHSAARDAGVANGPDADRFAPNRRRDEAITEPGSQHVGGRTDRIKVGRVGRQASRGELVVRASSAHFHGTVQIARIGSELHSAVSRNIRAPANDDVSRRFDLQIRPAHHLGRWNP